MASMDAFNEAQELARRASALASRRAQEVSGMIEARSLTTRAQSPAGVRPSGPSPAKTAAPMSSARLLELAASFDSELAGSGVRELPAPVPAAAAGDAASPVVFRRDVPAASHLAALAASGGGAGGDASQGVVTGVPVRSGAVVASVDRSPAGAEAQSGTTGPGAMQPAMAAGGGMTVQAVAGPTARASVGTTVAAAGVGRVQSSYQYHVASSPSPAPAAASAAAAATSGLSAASIQADSERAASFAKHSREVAGTLRFGSEAFDCRVFDGEATAGTADEVSLRVVVSREAKEGVKEWYASVPATSVSLLRAALGSGGGAATVTFGGEHGQGASDGAQADANRAVKRWLFDQLRVQTGVAGGAKRFYLGGVRMAERTVSGPELSVGSDVRRMLSTLVYGHGGSNGPTPVGDFMAGTRAAIAHSYLEARSSKDAVARVSAQVDREIADVKSSLNASTSSISDLHGKMREIMEVQMQDSQVIHATMEEVQKQVAGLAETVEAVPNEITQAAREYVDGRARELDAASRQRMDQVVEAASKDTKSLGQLTEVLQDSVRKLNEKLHGIAGDVRTLKEDQSDASSKLQEQHKTAFEDAQRDMRATVTRQAELITAMRRDITTVREHASMERAKLDQRIRDQDDEIRALRSAAQASNADTRMQLDAKRRASVADALSRLEDVSLAHSRRSVAAHSPAAGRMSSIEVPSPARTSDVKVNLAGSRLSRTMMTHDLDAPGSPTTTAADTMVSSPPRAMAARDSRATSLAVAAELGLTPISSAPSDRDDGPYGDSIDILQAGSRSSRLDMPMPAGR